MFQAKSGSTRRSKRSERVYIVYYRVDDDQCGDKDRNNRNNKMIYSPITLRIVLPYVAEWSNTNTTQTHHKPS